MNHLTVRFDRPTGWSGARETMVGVNNSRDYFLSMKKKTVLYLGLLLLCGGKVTGYSTFTKGVPYLRRLVSSIIR